jgi:hypothetical protein
MPIHSPNKKLVHAGSIYTFVCSSCLNVSFPFFLGYITMVKHPSTSLKMVEISLGRSLGACPPAAKQGTASPWNFSAERRAESPSEAPNVRLAGREKLWIGFVGKIFTGNPWFLPSNIVFNHGFYHQNPSNIVFNHGFYRFLPSNIDKYRDFPWVFTIK